MFHTSSQAENEILTNAQFSASGESNANHHLPFLFLLVSVPVNSKTLQSYCCSGQERTVAGMSVLVARAIVLVARARSVLLLG